MKNLVLTIIFLLCGQCFAQECDALITIDYADEKSKIPQEYKAEIDKLIEQLKKNKKLTIKILASAKCENQRKSKVASIDRAMEIRKYFFSKNVKMKQVTINAMWKNEEENKVIICKVKE